MPTHPRAVPCAVLCAVLLLAGVACGGDDDPGTGAASRGSPDGRDGPSPAAATPLGGTDSGIPAAGDSAAIARSVDEPCAMFGLWQPCSVVRRLESAGLGPVPVDGAVRQPGIAIEGSVLRLGRGELQIFLYADSLQARAAAERVEPEDAEAAHVRGMLRPPAVIRTANLVALLFNNNDRQLERVQLALTAGLPSP